MSFWRSRWHLLKLSRQGNGQEIWAPCMGNWIFRSHSKQARDIPWTSLQLQYPFSKIPPRQIIKRENGTAQNGSGKKLREVSSALSIRLDTLLHGRKDTSRIFSVKFLGHFESRFESFFHNKSGERFNTRCQPQVPMMYAKEASGRWFFMRSMKYEPYYLWLNCLLFLSKKKDDEEMRAILFFGQVSEIMFTKS